LGFNVGDDVMSFIRRTEIPITIAAIMTLIMLLDLFTGDPTLRAASTMLQSWAIILAGFALGIGAVSLLRLHTTNIKRKRPGWYGSVLIIFFTAAVLVTGLMDLNLANPILRFILDNMYMRLYAAAWAFEGIFLIYGLYRAFKIRNLDSLILSVTAFFCIIRNAAVAEVFFGPAAFAPGTWILDVPNLGGIRALMIASSLGILMLGLRTLLGKERGYIRTGG